jgi:RNA polymerase sigma-70 factor, ECF subfamily
MFLVATQCSIVPADLAFVESVAQGDAGARSRFVERLFDRVRALVSYLAHGHRDQDDFVQLTLVELLRSAHTFRGEGSLESWADRIATRTCLRLLKERRRRDAVTPLADEPGEDVGPADPDAPSPASGSAEDTAARRQVGARLAVLLSRLPEERRVVLVLRLVHDYDLAEIAEVTETPVNTVRDRLQTGKRELRGLVLRDPVLRELDLGGQP